jgi:chromosome segregation ATPase
LSLAVAFLAISLSGCRNKKEEARQKAEVTKALDQYKTQIAELQKQASGLRARLDKLPEDLPGIGTVRDDLHAIEEVLGVEDGHTKWLLGELDKAFTSGKKAEIEAVRNAIPRADDTTTQAIVKLAHQLSPLERLAAQRRFFESLDAERARKMRNEPPPKTR